MTDSLIITAITRNRPRNPEIVTPCNSFGRHVTSGQRESRDPSVATVISRRLRPSTTMQLYRSRLLSAAQLKRLGDHKYSCSSSSLLDAALQPWWSWLVLRLPLWLAPNLITTIGLAVNVFTSLILVW